MSEGTFPFQRKCFSGTASGVEKQNFGEKKNLKREFFKFDSEKLLSSFYNFRRRGFEVSFKHLEKAFEPFQ